MPGYDEKAEKWLGGLKGVTDDESLSIARDFVKRYICVLI